MNRNPNIDEQLREYYESAIYELDQPKILLIPGKLSPEMDVLLIDNNVYCASLLTAYNPRSVKQTAKENRIKQLELLKIVAEQRIAFILGRSKDPLGKWPEEAQILLLGIELKKVVALAAEFGQAAILHHQLNQPTELVWL